MATLIIEHDTFGEYRLPAASMEEAASIAASLVLLDASICLDQIDEDEHTPENRSNLVDLVDRVRIGITRGEQVRTGGTYRSLEAMAS